LDQPEGARVITDWRSAAIALCVTAGLCGCSTRADVDALNNNQLQLRDMVATDRQQVAQLEQRNRRLQDQIEELKRSGAGSGDAAKQLASLDDRLGKIEAAVSALQASNAATAAPSGAGASPGAPGPAAGVSTSSSPSAWQSDLDAAIEEAASTSGSGAKVYREGLAAMKDGKYPVAIAKFTTLQKKYPKSELSEPSEYFSANAFFEVGKYDQAILQLNDLVMRFPKGRYSSAALLREAQAFVRLNDKIDARLTLQKLLADHTAAPEATLASAMLRDLEN
jgi:TolA-binding protein